MSKSRSTKVYKKSNGGEFTARDCKRCPFFRGKKNGCVSPECRLSDNSDRAEAGRRERAASKAAKRRREALAEIDE